MMQSQGLGALMPQGAPAQQPQAMQMNNPRLAAATNLVSSDAEEQILDPRTLAMLKYKDALQAMQAADQMMAAAQPAPMPPTVAERTKMAAEQGIAGLASRLSPGLQQQGNRMQTQQLQQAVSGGLPQLSAPNMAGMAEGGIVGFQAGGAPEDAYAQPTDYLLPGRVGMLPRENLPTTREELQAEIERRERIQRLVENLRELDRTEVPGPYSGPSAAERRAMREEGSQTSVPSNTYGTGDRTGGQGRSVMEELRSARDVIGQGLGSIFNGVPGGSNIVGFTTEGSPIYAGRSSAQGESASTVATNETTPLEGSTLNLSALDRGAKTSTPASQTSLPVSPSGPDPELAGLASLSRIANAPVGATPNTSVAGDLANKRLEYLLNPEREEERRNAEEAKARAAYAVPEELKELIRARSKALDAPLYSPEEQRSREISALLSGLASSNLIAQGGPAASRGVREVEDEVRADARTRAERQFDLATGLIEQERGATQSAYAAGLEAARGAETGANQAVQSAIAQLSSLGEIDAARSMQQQQMQFDVIKVQMEAAAEQQRLGRYDAQTNATLAATVRGAIDDSQNAINTLQQTLAVTPPESQEPIQNAINALTLERNAVIARFNELTGVRAAPIEAPPTPTGEFDLTPEAADVFSRYGQ